MWRGRIKGGKDNENQTGNWPWYHIGNGNSGSRSTYLHRGYTCRTLTHVGLRDRNRSVHGSTLVITQRLVRICPHCKSAYWDVERKNKGGKG